MKIFRPKRAELIKSKFNNILYSSESKILDVGGGKYPWDILYPDASITILNIQENDSVPVSTNYKYVCGDGTSLSYADHSFDLVFSNSVIEHVGDYSAQTAFAGELLRTGKKIYCQTPNKWFFVEPHFITMFIHWLPFKYFRHMLRYFSVWGLVNKPSQHQIDNYIKSIRLLTREEIQALFPNCTIEYEKVFGMVKSFIITNKH